MTAFEGFSRGMGIGGWLTNYKRFHVIPEDKRMLLTIGDMEHFANYVTERDIKYISSLGMDHIRLGFDQITVETSPGTGREEVLQHIDDFIEWCTGCGMNIVLNMHKAVGNYCDIATSAILAEDEKLQAGFIACWEMLERRWHNKPEIVFELLNEITHQDPNLCNAFMAKAVAAIRRLNPARRLVIGAHNWNSPSGLSSLKVYDDPNVIYTFHFYAPHEFTHQRGVLMSGPLFYNRDMPYPGDADRYREYYKCVFNDDNAYKGISRIDREFLRSELEPAVQFKKDHPDKILWCGEFGTIRHANILWRENYMRDLISLLKEYEIPYCVWNYLSTPNDGNRFSLVDDDKREILSPELAKIISGNV